MAKGLYLSYSGYRMLKECGGRYAKDYILRQKPKKPDSKHNTVVGSTVQSVMEHLFKQKAELIALKKTEPGFDLKEHLVELTTKKMDEVIRGHGRGEAPYIDWGHFRCDSRGVMLSDSKKLVANALDQVKYHKLLTAGADSEMSLKTTITEDSNNIIGGYADFVIPQPDGSVMILDGKAGRSGMKYLSEDQLLMYALLWWRIHGELPSKLGFMFFRYKPEDAIHWVKCDMERVKNLQSDLMVAFKKIEEMGDTLPVTPKAKWCQWCPFEEECEPRMTQKAANSAKRRKAKPKQKPLEDFDLGL
jgi:CRISPR/Cas system-associated exonuclease Cas4 (RecB family)